jgi:hypothetical protein
MSKDPQQALELGRVTHNLESAICAFANMARKRTFKADELRAYVTRRVPGAAPASPDRVLRNLRAKSILDYEVISRSESTYRFTKLPSDEPADAR